MSNTDYHAAALDMQVSMTCHKEVRPETATDLAILCGANKIATLSATSMICPRCDSAPGNPVKPPFAHS